MAGDLISRKKKKKKDKPSEMEVAKKIQQPPTPTLSHAATKSRSRRNPLSDCTNDLTSPAANDHRVGAADEEDAPGTSFNPLGLNSMHSCDVPSSSGVGICSILRTRPMAAPTRKSKGKEVARLSTSSPIRVDLSGEIATSNQASFLPSLDNHRVEAIEGDAPGTSFKLLGLDSTPSRDVLFSSGRGDEFQTIYQRAATTRNSKGKDEILASSTGSLIRRSSRIRERPGEVEDRAVSESCSIPNRKVRKSLRDRAISKSCILPNKRILATEAASSNPGTDEASESLREFIRQQKSYFAEIDAFKLPEEEVSTDDDDSE